MTSTAYSATLLSNFSSFENNAQQSCTYDHSRISSLIFEVIIGVLTTSTLLVIVCNKRLRKQHTIIPFNIVLCDLVIVIVNMFTGLIGAHVEKVTWNIITYLFISFDFTSIFLILLAAIYQFINIRVDPFGNRHIITTPRIIAACILSWLLPMPVFGGLTTMGVADAEEYISYFSIELGFLIITGMFYVFLYRTVSKGPPGGAVSEERKRENRTIFFTILFVYLTSLIPRVIYLILFIIYSVVGSWCIFIIASVCYHVNTAFNSLVYWWRLKEFRSLLSNCRKSKVNFEEDATTSP